MRRRSTGSYSRGVQGKQQTQPETPTPEQAQATEGRVEDEYELPKGTKLAPTQTTQMNKARKTRWKGNTFHFYLQLISSYTKLDISGLAECIQSNRLRRMFAFHDCLFPPFSLASCLGRLASSVPDCITKLARILTTNFFPREFLIDLACFPA